MKIKNFSPAELEKAFPEIYRDIANIYPLGLRQKDAPFYESEGIRKIDALINDMIVNTHNYARWEKKMVSDIKEQTGLTAIGATYGYVPGLSGHIPLHEDDRFQTDLFFYISLAADYFSIEIIEFDKKKNVQDVPGYGTLVTPGVNSVTVSPFGAYSDLFSKVELYLRDNYRNYKFLPAYFDYVMLKGMHVLQSDDADNAVSSAFFSKIEKSRDVQVLGDSSFGDVSIGNIA